MRFKAIDKTWSTKENLVPKVLLVTIRHAEYVWMTSTDSDIHALLYGNPKYSCAGKKRFKNRKNLESFVKQFFPYIKEVWPGLKSRVTKMRLFLIQTNAHIVD